MAIIHSRRPKPRREPTPAEEDAARAFLDRMLADGRAALAWARERPEPPSTPIGRTGAIVVRRRRRR